MKPLFCNSCHRRIDPPAFLKNANIGGRVILNCGHPGCKGKVIIGKKPKKEEPINTEEHGKI